MPPPAAAAASMARFTASVSSVLPSPTAPYCRTSKTPLAAALIGFEGDSANERQGAAVAATPKAPVRKKLLRRESKLVIKESSLRLWLIQAYEFIVPSGFESLPICIQRRTSP